MHYPLPDKFTNAPVKRAAEYLYVPEYRGNIEQDESVFFLGQVYFASNKNPLRDWVQVPIPDRLKQNHIINSWQVSCMEGKANVLLECSLKLVQVSDTGQPLSERLFFLNQSINPYQQTHDVIHSYESFRLSKNLEIWVLMPPASRIALELFLEHERVIAGPPSITARDGIFYDSGSNLSVTNIRFDGLSTIPDGSTVRSGMLEMQSQSNVDPLNRDGYYAVADTRVPVQIDFQQTHVIIVREDGLGADIEAPAESFFDHLNRAEATIKRREARRAAKAQKAASKLAAAMARARAAGEKLPDIDMEEISIPASTKKGKIRSFFKRFLK